jgi:phosphoribosylformylglycinamidine (FGAM) synthase-like enzyme
MTQQAIAIDTVEIAKQTPEREQPFAELGLKDDEYARIREILGRRPTSSELSIYSVMWSEHCSYKSSKVHLRQFADKAPQTDALLVGMGENAGVVDVGQGWAVTFKIESHNHPSYVEPYQGAATGVGGIVRDILTMGARPIAIMDPLRFGLADAADTARVLPGIVAGIGGYGNCLGLPNIGGEVVFDASYSGNPLVNALCVGVMRTDGIKLAHASGAGNQVILFGARTGRDGIGGVSVLASATFGDDGLPANRPAVQVGDPFMEKVLIECCLEIFEQDLVVGIQDLGGAGLSCATSELASAGDGGMLVHLDRVPLREASMVPEEVLASESQERMCAVVAPDKVEQFLAVCAKWEVEAVTIGEVTETGRLQILWHGETIVDAPPRTIAHDGPVYDRPIARPDTQDALNASLAEDLTRPVTGEELRATLLQMVASPNLADKSWVTDQFDRYVMGNTVLAQPEDAGMVRIAEGSDLGIALATDGNVSFYNQTGSTPILPTPVIGVLGVIDDVTRRTPQAFAGDGSLIYLLGDTGEEFGGSEWANVVHSHLGGLPPQVDLAREALLGDVLINSSRDGLIDSAHDVSDGGVAQTIVESCLRGNVGARLVVPEGLDAFAFLFSESAGRAIVSVPRSEEIRFTDMCTARALPCARIGVVDILAPALEVQGAFTVPLKELRAAWSATFPALFEH